MHKLCSWVRSAQGGVKSLCRDEPQQVPGEPRQGGSEAQHMEINPHPATAVWEASVNSSAAKLMLCGTCTQILHG